MQKEEDQKPTRPIEYRLPPQGLPSVYSNNVRMSTSNFDVRMVFGQSGEVEDGKIIVDQRVQVTMTWPQVKILADFLQANVKAFEDLNGPMKLPMNLEKLIAPETFPNPTKSPIQ
jgi:hypothetical protein